MHRGKLHLQSITLDLCQGRFEGKLLYTGDFAICANKYFETGFGHRSAGRSQCRNWVKKNAAIMDD